MKYFQIISVIATLSSAGRASADAGRVGVMADVGVPDGATASLVVRPLAQIKVHGGVGYNLIAPGLRAGVSVAPITWIITPTVNVEAGHYFRGDANRAVNMFGGGKEEDGSASDSPVLREVGYQYANFHLGLDVGGDRVTVYLHAGMSAIRGTIRNLDEQLNDDRDGDDPEMDGATIEVRDDPVVNLWVPSARFGLIFFF